MRWQLIIAILTIEFGFQSFAFAEEEFPYTAKIAIPTAAVRSGPADVHYLTTELATGDSVEVYRRDPGGWLAIRPGEGEFSLVRAKFVVANFSKGVGHITRDGVRSWIGTESTAANQPEWQIQFRKGDPLRLIGKQQIEDSSGALQTWYEIAPPAGEFRWVHELALKTPAAETAPNKQSISSGTSDESEKEANVASNVDINSESKWGETTSTQSETISTQNGSVDTAAPMTELTATGPPEPKPFEPVRLQPGEDGMLAASQPPNQINLISDNIAATDEVGVVAASEPPTQQIGWQIASMDSSLQHDAADRTTHQATAPVGYGLINAKTTFTAEASDQQASAIQALESNRIVNSGEPNRLGTITAHPVGEYASQTITSQANSTATSSTFDDQFRAIELGLTMAVLEPTDRWQLKPFREAVMKASSQAVDVRQRKQVNDLLEKIGDFEHLQKKHASLNRKPRESRTSRPAGKTNVKKKASVSTRSESNRTRPQSSPAKKTKTRQDVVQAAFFEDLDIASGDEIVTTNNLLPANNQRSTSSQPSSSGQRAASVAIGSGTEQKPESKKSVLELLKKPSKQATEPLDESIYAATGWLNRLYSSDGTGINGFVLQNENGEIIQTVLPTPGVKIDRYLNKEVGLIGRRGFNTKFKLPHVTVDKAILLERHRQTTTKR